MAEPTINGFKLDPPDEVLQFAKENPATFSYDVKSWHWTELPPDKWKTLPASYPHITEQPECHQGLIGEVPLPPPPDYKITSLVLLPGGSYYAGMRPDGVAFWSTKMRPAELAADEIEY